MRINESTAILGKDVILVPYRSEHVEKYHEWLKDPEIQQATASEPLTLEEEYEMQKSWHLDEDKLTFIVLQRKPDIEIDSLAAHLTRNMIGDVNLFLSDMEDDADEEGGASTQAQSKQGELEIMIAETSARRKGLATQALELMIAYASRPPLNLGPAQLLARIGMANEASISMFEKLGFAIVRRVEVFREVEMRVEDARRFEGVARQELNTVTC